MEVDFVVAVGVPVFVSADFFVAVFLVEFRGLEGHGVDVGVLAAFGEGVLFGFGEEIFADALSLVGRGDGGDVDLEPLEEEGAGDAANDFVLVISGNEEEGFLGIIGEGFHEGSVVGFIEFTEPGQNLVLFLGSSIWVYVHFWGLQDWVV